MVCHRQSARDVIGQMVHKLTTEKLAFGISVWKHYTIRLVAVLEIQVSSVILSTRIFYIK